LQKAKFVLLLCEGGGGDGRDEEQHEQDPGEGGQAWGTRIKVSFFTHKETVSRDSELHVRHTPPPSLVSDYYLKIFSNLVSISPYILYYFSTDTIIRMFYFLKTIYFICLFS
jgi:hypothetical protein